MILYILLGLNAVFGAFLLEVAWKYTRLHRNKDEIRDSHFPSWRRNDLKHWSRLKLYPGALTIMPLRMIMLIVISTVCLIFHKILLRGVDFSKPFRQEKRRKSKLIFKWLTNFAVYLNGIIPVPNNVEMDYSYWLGEDYKEVT